MTEDGDEVEEDEMTVMMMVILMMIVMIMMMMRMTRMMIILTDDGTDRQTEAKAVHPNRKTPVPSAARSGLWHLDAGCPP